MNTQVEAILLAAGESTRMHSLKALLEWEGKPLVSYQIDQLLRGGAAAVIVVLGHEADTVREVIDASAFPPDAVRLAYNPEYRTSKAASVRAGAAQLSPATTGALLLGVDQPRPDSVTTALLRAHGDSPDQIVVPIYAERRGHPILLPARLFDELKSVDDATLGLRAVVSRHKGEVREVPLHSAVVLTDINDPSSYAVARAEWLRERSR